MNEIFEYIGYSEDSPTNLIAIRDKFMWNGKLVYTKNDVVGSFTHRSNGDPKCIRVRFNGKTYHAHNLVWELFNNKLPNGLIDHIDGNPFNNVISNLEVCTQAVNCRRKKVHKVIDTGLRYHTLKGYDYWRAQYTDLDGKIHLKYFSILKLGFNAKVEAKLWRDTQITLMNKSGAGYKESNGTVHKTCQLR